MSNGLLLWVDDEIELLKAHIIFLQKKGYEVETVSNGTDAVDKCRTCCRHAAFLQSFFYDFMQFAVGIKALGAAAQHAGIT